MAHSGELADMTTRTAACAPRLRLLALSALLLALLAPAAPASAEDFALDCEVVAGILSLRLTGPGGVDVQGRALDEHTWVYEIGDPSLKGLRPGPLSCVSVQAVRVLPGYMLGTRTSRIVVTHAGGEPRAFSQGGRHRLTWLPEARSLASGMDREPEPRPAPVPEPLPPSPDDDVMSASRDDEKALPSLVDEGMRSGRGDEVTHPARGDEELLRLQAEVAAQRDENARLRERLAAEVPPPAAAPPPPLSGRERKQQEKAEKQAAREAKKVEKRAAKDARKQQRRSPPPSGGEPGRTEAASQSPPPQPARETVVVSEPPRPSGPAPTPRALPPEYAAFPAASDLVVTIPADLRDGPGRRYRTLRRLGAGERLPVTGRAGDWYRVGRGEGWVFASYLAAATAGGGASSQLGVVQEVTVPVHEGPGGQHAVVAELYRGQQVVIDELKGEWAHVRNGGWVRRSALGDLKPGQESSK